MIVGIKIVAIIVSQIPNERFSTITLNSTKKEVAYHSPSLAKPPTKISAGLDLAYDIAFFIGIVWLYKEQFAARISYLFNNPCFSAIVSYT